MPTTKARRTATKKRSTKQHWRSKPARRTKARRSPAGKAGPVNDWMELRHSEIHGIGAFAVADIPKRTRIIEYTGEKISNPEADRRYDDAKMRRHHTFLFILNDRTCVDAAYDGNAARFMNHSCDPNC